MFDKPYEIGLTINLLRPKYTFPIGADFDKKFISVKKTKNDDYENNTSSPFSRNTKSVSKYKT